MRRCKWLLGLGLLLAPGGWAQPRGMSRAWWDGPVAENLNLSGEQRQQIRSTVRDSRSRLMDLRMAVDRAESDVKDAFDAELVDQKRANEAIERLATARADLTRALSQMTLRLRTVLTVDQWRELQQRGPERGPRPPGRGPRRDFPRE